MRKEQQQLILAKDDHQTIMGCIKQGLESSTFRWKDVEALEAELKKATLVEKELMPEDVVCINSTVVVKEEKADKVMELTLVTPGRADIKQRRISILSPVAAALIGFRKGMKVAWKVPSGLKTFRILDVRNSLQGS